jgi:hypothetical protein
MTNTRSSHSVDASSSTSMQGSGSMSAGGSH